MNSSSTGEKVLLAGHSTNITLGAVLLTMAAGVIVGVLSPMQGDWSAILIVPAVFGGMAGYCISWAQSRIAVLADEVVLTNVGRIGRVRREAVREILAGSGIAIVLKQGKVLSSSAFPPSLGKVLLHNRRDMHFAEQLGTTLDVPVTENTDVADDSIESDPAVSWSIRWQTLGYTVGGAALCAAVAAVIHGTVQG